VDLINYEVTAARYDFVKGVTLVMGGQLLSVMSIIFPRMESSTANIFIRI